jgi:hypothetical protein
VSRREGDAGRLVGDLTSVLLPILDAIGLAVMVPPLSLGVPVPVEM